MGMKSKIVFSFLFVFSFITFNSFTQSFEGVITIKETVRSNTILKKITVKGDKVKLETFADEAGNDLKGIKIIDLASGKVTALMPSRKLYFEVPSKPAAAPANINVEPSGASKNISVKTGDATKEYACKEILVTSQEKKTKISYWIAEGSFSFYLKMLRALGKSESTSEFYLKMGEKHPNALPLIIEEKRLDNTEISKQEVTEINESSVDDSVFEIPSDYSLMER